MTALWIAAGLGYAAAMAGVLPEPLPRVFGSAAVLLFPGGLVVRLAGMSPSPLRDLLAGPALSPVVLGIFLAVGMLAGLPGGPLVHGLVLASGALGLLAGNRLVKPDLAFPPLGKLTWAVAALFALIVAVVLVPSPWRRITLDAWFHTAVVHEIARAGIPPQDPYFAPLPLQYFWFFHVVLYGLGTATRLAPPEAMALLNVCGAALCVAAAAFAVRAMGFDRKAGRWAGAMMLLGLGGLWWLFLPVKLLRIFLGDVRGAEELGYIFRLRPFDVETVAGFFQVLRSSDFLLRKYLVGTAVSWELVLMLVTLGAALRFAATGRRPWLALQFLGGTGALLFHIVFGGTGVIALACGGALAARPRETRGRGLAVAGTAIASILVCVPYLASVAGGGDRETVVPVGIDLLHWASLAITLAGVGALAIPVVGALRRRGERLFLGFLIASLLYGLFGRLPGANQYYKPAIVAFLPLALAAGCAVPLLWERWRGRPRLRAAFAAFLVLFLVPENAMRLASYIVEDEGPGTTAAERALYDWIGTETPRDAVFLDSGDRVDVLVRGPRRQYWGLASFAEQWGYSRRAMDERRGLRDAVYGDAPLARERFAGILGLGVPVYVVAREADRPGIHERLGARPDLFREVFRAEGHAVFRMVPGPGGG